MAKITFLGTGGDAYIVGKQIRGAGGILVTINDNQFHLDPGPGSLPAAKAAGIELRHTVGILVSHAHLNHAGDVNAVLSAMSYGGLDPHGVLLAADSVINGSEDASPVLSTFHARCAERVITLAGVPRVGINRIEVRVVAAHHTDAKAVGFQLAGEKEVISYTGDTGFSQEVIDGHRGANVLIACVSHAKPSQFHLTPDDCIALANAVKPKTLILTHFGHELHKQDVRSVGRHVSKGVECHVIVAEDGLVVDTATYR